MPKLDIDKLRDSAYSWPGGVRSSRLRTAFERYIGMRQGLGYKYDGPAKRLSEFVGFHGIPRRRDHHGTDLAME